MNYLAVLMYDCGCAIESCPGFMRPINFHAGNDQEVDERLSQLKQRTSRGGDGNQCRRTGPIEIRIFDDRFKQIRDWREEDDKSL